MKTTQLSTVSNQMLECYANTARNVIHAYRCGGTRVVHLAEQRWNKALNTSRPQLDSEVAGNATAAQRAVSRYAIKGLEVSSGGAQTLVNQVAKLAGASIDFAATNASRFDEKLALQPLSRLASVAMPGALVLSSLATKVEQKSTELVNRLAADDVVVPVAKRARAPARKPRVARAARSAAPAAPAEAAVAAA